MARSAMYPDLFSFTVTLQSWTLRHLFVRLESEASESTRRFDVQKGRAVAFDGTKGRRDTSCSRGALVKEPLMLISCCGTTPLLERKSTLFVLQLSDFCRKRSGPSTIDDEDDDPPLHHGADDGTR